MRLFLVCFFLGVSMITHANDRLTINVKTNSPSFEVTLPANATTGFQWSVVRFDKKLLKLSTSSYERPQTNLIGSGGKMHFIFTLQKSKNYPASTDIVFKYARSWEPASATIQNVTVNFVTADGKKGK